MAKKQFMICEPGKDNAEWFVLGTWEEIEEVILDIIKTSTDPVDEIKIFEITPVDFSLKLVITPKAKK